MTAVDIKTATEPDNWWGTLTGAVHSCVHGAKERELQLSDRTARLEKLEKDLTFMRQRMEHMEEMAAAAVAVPVVEPVQAVAVPAGDAPSKYASGDSLDDRLAAGADSSTEGAPAAEAAAAAPAVKEKKGKAATRAPPPRRMSVTTVKNAGRRFSEGGTLQKRDPPTDEELKMLIPNKMPFTAVPLLGPWKCVEINGFENYLKDLGFPWVIRKAVCAVKPTLTFFVKSFSEEEVKLFDKFLKHADTGTILGCSITVGPKKLGGSEPLVGFEGPALLGPKVKETINRKFEGDTLVTLRDWAVLRNAKKSFVPLPTDMRCTVEPGQDGAPDMMREHVTWEDPTNEKRKGSYYRLFKRGNIVDLWDQFQGSAPQRADGKYYTWTDKGVTFATKYMHAKKEEAAGQGVMVGLPFTLSHFNMLYYKSAMSNPNDAWDWNRMRGYI